MQSTTLGVCYRCGDRDRLLVPVLTSHGNESWCLGCSCEPVAGGQGREPSDLSCDALGAALGFAGMALIVAGLLVAWAVS